MVRSVAVQRRIPGKPINSAALVTAVVLTFCAVLVLFPFVFALSTSTKSYDEFLHQLWLPRFPPEWSNYAIAWQLETVSQISFLREAIQVEAGHGQVDPRFA